MLHKCLPMLLVLLCATGCTISRAIVDVEAPDRPPLQRLEENLTYVDPDRGQSDYIIE